jgi:hypothetical protein
MAPTLVRDARDLNTTAGRPAAELVLAARASSASRYRLLGGLLRLQKDSNLGDRFVQHCMRHALYPLRTPEPPVETLHLIGQDHALNPHARRKRNLDQLRA